MQRSVADVLVEHTDRLLDLPGVVGTGEGLLDGRPCVKLFLETGSPEVLAGMPSQLEGYPVVIEVTGPPHAL